jgi:hypothetical protein
VTDTFGNKGISANTTVVVNAAPTVTVTGPANGTTVFVDSAQVISANAFATTPGARIKNVQFYANDILQGEAVTIPPYQVSWTPAAPTTAVVLKAIATDTNDIQTTSAPVSIAVNQTPTVAIGSPLGGASVGVNTTQTITAAATPAGFITNVQFFADGAPLGAVIAAPYSVSWTPATAGSYNLTAVVTNRLGTTVTSTPVVVAVTAAAPVGTPTVAITGPSSPVTVNSQQTISATANVAKDTTGAITSVQFFVNGIALSTDVGFPFSATWTPVSPGTYVLAAKATDSNGGQQTSAAEKITVAAGAPPTDVTVTVPKSVPVNSAQTITGAAAAASGLTIASVQFFVNGVLLSTDTTYPYSATWTPAALGSYSISTMAIDTAGNQTTSTVTTVSVAAGTVPKVELTNPAADSTFTASNALNLSASAEDTDGTIVSVQFLVNGLVQGGADTTAPYSATWTPTAAGTYILTAQATDNSGNVTTSAPVKATITLNGAPTVSIISPAAGASASTGTAVSLSANASDADGTIASVRFLVNGSVVGSASATLPFTTVWTPSVKGTYTLVA